MVNKQAIKKQFRSIHSANTENYFYHQEWNNEEKKWTMNK